MLLALKAIDEARSRPTMSSYRRDEEALPAAVEHVPHRSQRSRHQQLVELEAAGDSFVAEGPENSRRRRPLRDPAFRRIRAVFLAQGTRSTSTMSRFSADGSLLATTGDN